jgi:hypothetical protein
LIILFVCAYCAQFKYLYISGAAYLGLGLVIDFIQQRNRFQILSTVLIRTTLLLFCFYLGNLIPKKYFVLVLITPILGIIFTLVYIIMQIYYCCIEKLYNFSVILFVFLLNLIFFGFIPLILHWFVNSKTDKYTVILAIYAVLLLLVMTLYLIYLVVFVDNKR